MIAPTPRYYQREAIQEGVIFLKTCKKRNYHGLIIMPGGSGKSVVIANTALAMDGDGIVFQPSKEILEQNFTKYISYGYRAGIYSASGGMKFRDKVTFATIGSVITKAHIFESVKWIIIDECHLVNSKAGMYLKFIESIPGVKVIGFTASPYRLATVAGGTMLRFLTRTSPRVFNRVLYYVQNDLLFKEGYLAPLRYFSFNVINKDKLELNSTGSDFTDKSLRKYAEEVNLPGVIASYANRILKVRKNILIFTTFVEEANAVARLVPGCAVLSAKTDDRAREKIIALFRNGTIPAIANVGVLTTGFDFPELETVLLGHSTMSLGLYVQEASRVTRPLTYPDGTKKQGWIIDIGGNIKKFGKLETMHMVQDDSGRFSVWNNGRQLTNVLFERN